MIKAMFKDYLGQAIVIEHERNGSNPGSFISFYAHTKPHDRIEVGMIVEEGDIIATLADTGHAKAQIIPHLHLSLGRPAKSFSYDGLVWNTIRKPEEIILLDPLPVIDWPYQALGASESFCHEL